MCETVHWSMIDLPEAIPLKKTDCSSSRGHHLLVVPQLGWSLMNHILFHGKVLVGLILYQSCARCVSSRGQQSYHVQDVSPCPPQSLTFIFFPIFLSRWSLVENILISFWGIPFLLISLVSIVKKLNRRINGMLRQKKDPYHTFTMDMVLHIMHIREAELIEW